jgi:hypothetical protein
MSSVIIAGNTSGTITLDAPAVAGTTTLTLPTTSGTITTKDTNGILSVNGIQFPATQSASADANCLDDYEEGTWTPVIADATTGGNVGTLSNIGSNYVKVGKLVTLNSYLSTINTTGMTAGNTLKIRNLPFTINDYPQGNFYTYRVGRNASTVSSSVFGVISGTAVQLQLYTTNSATVDATILVSNIVSGTSEIVISITYTTT